MQNNYYRMKRYYLLLVAAVLFVSACSQTETQQQDAEDLAVKVKVQDVKIKKVDQTIEFTGNILPMKQNYISSAAAQRIEKIYVEVGTEVKEGDVLVEMEDLNYNQAKIQLENLRIDLARTEALYNAGGISRQQYDQLKTQVLVAEESLANLAKNTKLISPVSGIVTQKNFEEGDVAGGQPILVVMQMEPVKILINISEEFYPDVHKGTPVSILLDIYPDQVFEGRVMLVHPTIDAATRSFVAEVRINNPSLKLRPGMFARAVVSFGEKDRVIIPDRSVIKQVGTNNKYVYVLRGDVVEYVQVQLGRRIGDIYEVMSGVQPGDKVVVAGHTALENGAKVKVEESGIDLSM